MDIDSLRTIVAKASAYREAAILMAVNEVARVTPIVTRRVTIEEIATDAGGSRHLLHAILDAAVAIGILSKTSDGYTLTREYHDLYDRAGENAKTALRYHIEYFASWQSVASPFGSAPHLAEMPAPVAQSTASPSTYRDFIRGVHDAHISAADIVAEHVRPGHFRTLVDLGCGGGTYAIALLRRQSSARGVLVDFESALEVADELCCRAGVRDRVTLIPENILQRLPQANADVVLLSNVLHLFTRAQATDLMRRVADAYPHAIIYVNEPLLTDDRTAPTATAVFNLTAILRSGNVGGLFTNTELDDLAVAGGLLPHTAMDIDADTDLYLRPYTLKSFRRLV